MYSSAWNWTAPTDKVFNGWYVVTDNSKSGVDGGRYLIDNGTDVPYRIMPGDGIKITYNQAGSISYEYNSTNGVLTIATPDKSGLVLTLEAQWDYSGSNPSTIFTNIRTLKGDTSWGALSYNINGATTIDGNDHKLTLSTGLTLTQDIYFKNITLKINGTMEFGSGLYANGHRLIIGENVTTDYSGRVATNKWYQRINDDPGATHAGFILFGGNNDSKTSNATHVVVQSGTFSSVIGGGNTGGVSDTYVSIGSTGSTGPTIFAVYGGSYDARAANTNIQVNSGTIMELLGGGRYKASDSNSTEVTGGYVSYLNGAQRSGNTSVGSGNDTVAVHVSVVNGKIDYLYGGVKDGNTDADNHPVDGNIEIKVTG
ncbi:hypothetical protein, partial [Candidatus Methanomassiliicoccus intestinalis]|uniref:hypothetical protein n=1 Tax=Candidatus Methanomassiliicoccus intestinalis TaxID=1406512 RepID=UPI0037DD16FA